MSKLREIFCTYCGCVFWCSSDDSAMRYFLPVLWMTSLWMTSCFHLMRQIGQTTLCFVESARWQHRAKSDVYDCLFSVRPQPGFEPTSSCVAIHWIQCVTNSVTQPQGINNNKYLLFSYLVLSDFFFVAIFRGMWIRHHLVPLLMPDQSPFIFSQCSSYRGKSQEGKHHVTRQP